MIKLVELVKDETTVSLDKETVRVSRTMVEDYSIDEYLNAITKIEMGVESLDAQKKESQNLAKSLTGGEVRAKAQEIKDESQKKMEQERKDALEKATKKVE